MSGSFKRLQMKMQSEGVDVRIDVAVDSGGDSEFRFVEDIKRDFHSHFC